MRIIMHKPEIRFFRKTLEDAEVYFEFGLGGSTVLAANEYSNIKKIAGIDSKKQWRDRVLNNIQEKDKVDLRYIEMGECTKKGTPLVKNLEIWTKYPESIHEFDILPDLVLVDGRWRMACLIQTILLSRKLGFNPKILLHDALRPHYKEVGDLCEKIGEEKTLILLEQKKSVKTAILEEKYDHYKHLTT